MMMMMMILDGTFVRGSGGVIIPFMIFIVVGIIIRMVVQGDVFVIRWGRLSHIAILVVVDVVVIVVVRSRVNGDGTNIAQSRSGKSAGMSGEHGGTTRWCGEDG